MSLVTYLVNGRDGWEKIEEDVVMDIIRVRGARKQEKKIISMNKFFIDITQPQPADRERERAVRKWSDIAHTDWNGSHGGKKAWFSVIFYLTPTHIIILRHPTPHTIFPVSIFFSSCCCYWLSHPARQTFAIYSHPLIDFIVLPY